jgi:hypothetical protein
MYGNTHMVTKSNDITLYSYKTKSVNKNVSLSETLFPSNNQNSTTIPSNPAIALLPFKWYF